MKKNFLFISLLCIGWFAIADNSFPEFPMTIYGDIKVWTTDLAWWTIKVYNSSNTELASFDITTAWQYWSNNATENHLLLNKFDGTLSFKVTYNGKNYIIDSIDDSNKWEWCPSKDSITFVSSNCRYDIILKEEVVSNPSTWWGWGGSWWGWWWWGGGWGGWWWKDTSKTTEPTVDTWAVVDTWTNAEIKSEDEDTSQEIDTPTNPIDTSRYQEWNQSEKLDNWYTREFNNAYEFAHRAGITTMDDINKANMNGWLNRIAMAKMLANYAINILGKKPANKVVPKFPDVNQQLNDDYGWAVDLAYQLWIMGIWTDKFRPYDPVTRKEFGTSLSRMLFGLADGTNLYYETHLKKLKEVWIISNDNPELTELRWYVMTMLMRSAMK